MPRYILYGNRPTDPDVYTLVPADRAVTAAVFRVATIEADSWEDACRRRNELLGWEPYKPMET